MPCTMRGLVQVVVLPGAFLSSGHLVTTCISTPFIWITALCTLGVRAHYLIASHGGGKGAKQHIFGVPAWQSLPHKLAIVDRSSNSMSSVL